MDAVTKLQIAALLKEADHAADPRTNGLLDRDELTAIIRDLVGSTRMLLNEAEAPFTWSSLGFPAPTSLGTCENPV